MKSNLFKLMLVAAIHSFVITPYSNAQVINTIAGNATMGYSGDGGPALSAQFAESFGLATDNAGNLYISDITNSVIRKVNAAGIISTIAGIAGSFSYSGDGGLATSATLHDPSGIALDGAGNLYIADRYNSVIRKVDLGGIISTIAGNGTPGYSGDGGPATAALLKAPIGIAADPAGNVYVAESNHTIRKINTAGIISTIAGTGTAGYCGDGGPATAACMNSPCGIALDGIGNIYVADPVNYRVRKVDTAGIITTVAGNGSPGSISSGPATAANLASAQSVACDAMGNIYIGDWGPALIKKVNSAGIISLSAGTGAWGYTGDGGPATAAAIHCPTAIAVDAAGSLYLIGKYSYVVRKIGNPMSIGAASNAKRALVYPNPAKDQVIIENAPSGTLSIYDVLGREILNSPINTDPYILDISSLSRGMFIVELKNNNSTQAIKVIKE
jgi:hypothetical protein